MTGQLAYPFALPPLGRVSRAKSLHALTPRILQLCRKYEIEAGPLVLTARHCQGLYHLSRGDFSAAEGATQQEAEDTARAELPDGVIVGSQCNDGGSPGQFGWQ